jgi:hypothetical protein
MIPAGAVRIGIVATVLTVGAVGCAPIRAHSYMPRGIQLTEYRTYGWASGQAKDTGDARLDENRFFFERMESEVDRRLAERGLERTDSSPELLVHVHANISQKVEGTRGTLMLDCSDARTGTLVWRGWSNEVFDGAIDDQQLMNEKIADAIEQIVKQMPRAGS